MTRTIPPTVTHREAAGGDRVQHPACWARFTSRAGYRSRYLSAATGDRLEDLAARSTSVR